MANTIRIKRRSGTTAPATSDLSAGELGWVDGSTSLYIGDMSNGVVKIGAQVDTGTSLGTSDNKVPTQGAVKSYVDSQVSAKDALAELTDDVNITNPADASMLLYDTGTSKWRDGVMSGDATMDDTGALTIASSAVEDGMLAGSISFTKLADSANIARLDQAETVAAVWSFGSNVPQASADPSAANDLARKNYVDGLVQGLKVSSDVRVATTANGALATAYENGDTVDGVALATNDRILIKDQTTASENGIYTVNASGAPTRASDFDSSTEVANVFVFVTAGTSNADTGWVCTNDPNSTSVGSDSITFAQFSAAGHVTAGTGLTKAGNTLSVNNNLSNVTGLGTVSSGTWQATTLATGYGGTGLTSYSSGDIIYASAANTLSALAKGTDGEVLQLASGVPSWGAIDGGTF